MENLIVRTNPKSPISEAYRSIRTSIQFANVDGKIKTIMCTSATAGEGKSTTIANVALTLADTGAKIVIIDCDFRKPRLHQNFNVSNAKGMTDILLTGVKYQEHMYKSIYPNVDIITSGKIPKNPSELLYSQAMRQLIENLKTDYDYVFIDAPPILPVTDSVIMSAYIDRVILVCASGHVNVEAVQRAKGILENAGANILGLVLNKVPIKNQKYSSYYYYYSNKRDE